MQPRLTIPTCCRTLLLLDGRWRHFCGLYTSIMIGFIWFSRNSTISFGSKYSMYADITLNADCLDTDVWHLLWTDLKFSESSYSVGFESSRNKQLFRMWSISYESAMRPRIYFFKVGFFLGDSRTPAITIKRPLRILSVSEVFVFSVDLWFFRSSIANGKVSLRTLSSSCVCEGSI